MDTAENLIYSSYLKARDRRYDEKDRYRRHPEYTRPYIVERCAVPACVVTGSKGKGSLAKMSQTILSTVYRTGLMISPHVINFEERFSVDGLNIKSDELDRYAEAVVSELQPVQETIPANTCISPMGIQTLIALDWFADMGTRFNIFECGKGAQYDDVNSVIHQYALIGPIFLEHTRELGDTLAEIASDKAHVITSETKTVFCARQQPEVEQLIIEKARNENADFRIYGRDFEAMNVRCDNDGITFTVRIGSDIIDDLFLPVIAPYQAENCALAIAFARVVLQEQFDLAAIRDVLSRWNWPGRMQVVSSKPFILADMCINRQSAIPIARYLQETGRTNCTLILAIPDDKDYMGVAQVLSPYVSKLILSSINNPHYRFTDIQAQTLSDFPCVSSVRPIEKALETVDDSPLLILGTVRAIGTALEILKAKNL